MKSNRSASRLAALVVVASALVASGCGVEAVSETLGEPAAEPVDPTGAWMQVRSAIFDSRDLGPSTEPVLWEIFGAELVVLGQACETRSFAYSDNRVSDLRTIQQELDSPGCLLTATLRTELVFVSPDRYVGSVDIVGDFSGSCEGACRTVFDISASRCANPVACTPLCFD